MKNRSLKWAACSFFLLFAALANAQSAYFPQDWANYNSYLDVAKEVQAEGSVHEFSGAVNYSFGFYSLGLDGQSFPVGINYFSSGVKVDEYASAVGMGWTLSAGGSITKITRGLDDDATNGYNTVAVSSPTAHKQDIYAGTRDGEKDYYVFNAFGLSGSFIYDQVNHVYTPMSGEKIEITYSASPSPNFTIKDHNGNAYYFTLQETIYTYLGSLSNPMSSVKGNWFLTSVTTAGNKEISLVYEAKNIAGFKTSFSEMRGVGSSQSCGTAFPFSGEQTIYNSYDSYRVTSIYSPYESLSFTYDTRTDITGDKALTKVEVSRNGTLFKRYLLNHSYLSGRLMLDAVVDKNYSTGVEATLVNFDYYQDATMSLPVSSESQDAAGYFNAAPVYTNSYNPVNIHSSLLPATPSPHQADGADRSIGAVTAVQTLMLKKVSNQFGKVQEFVYENNFYGTAIGYGVRVSKVVSYDRTQPARKKYIRYLYEDEAGNPTGVRTNTIDDLIIYASYQGSSQTCYGIIRKSASSSKSVRVVDYLGVYTKVKTRVYTDESDVSGSSLGYSINEYTMDPTPINHSSGTSVWTVAKYRWGLPKSSKNYNTANQLVDETAYTYNVNPYGQSVNVFAYMGSMYGATPDVVVQTYELNIGPALLTEVLHKTYSTNAVLLLTEKKTFTYDALRYVSQVDLYRNNVLKESVTYTRPSVFSISPGNTNPYIRAIEEMKSRKIYAPVLETITYKRDVSPEVITAASLTLYKYDFTKNIIQPASSFAHVSLLPLTTFTALQANNTNITYHSSYTPVNEVVTYDDIYPAAIKTNGLEFSASYFSRNGNAYCAFGNAALEHTAFMGFESYEQGKLSRPELQNGGWNLLNTCGGSLASTAYTGDVAFNLGGCTGSSVQLSKTLDPARKYVLQFWKKTGSGTAAADVVGTARVLRTVNGWELLEYDVENETGLSVTGTGIIDDVRLFPVEASYAYSTFNALDYKTSECDGSGNCVFYDYDEHYRMRTVKDAAGNILKRMEYGILEQQ